MKSQFIRGLIKILASGVMLFGALVGSAYASQGVLEILYDINDPSYDNSYCKSNHVSGATEEPNDPTWDVGYGNRLFSPNGKGSKIISKFDPNNDPNELKIDSRPLDSNTPVNLELSIHTQSGGSVNFSNHESELKFDFPGAGWDFGNEPITLQQYDPCDPNIIYPVYDVRRTIEGNGGVTPLPELNGTYQSEVPYTYFRLYFDRFLGDVDYSGRVDFKDFAILAKDWGQSGNLAGDICGPNGIPDNNADGYDLMAFGEDWLKDVNDPDTW